MKNKVRNSSFPIDKNSVHEKLTNNNGMGKSRYLHYTIFITLVTSSFLNINAFWGLLFISWSIPAYLNRRVFFIDMIDRDNEPLFYWAVFTAWVGFGVLMVLMDIPLIMQSLSA